MDFSDSTARITMADKIKSAINEMASANRPQRYSTRLSPSNLGHECAAYLWYKWHWATAPQPQDGRMARYNENGERNEERVTEWLRSIGFTVRDKDEKGEQLSATDFNGHLYLKIDGEGSHPIYTGGQTVLLEYKYINSKRFVALTKESLKLSDEKYYGQVVLYLMYRNLPACLFIPNNRNDDDIKPAFIPRDDGYARELLRKGETIITSPVRPARIAESPAFYKCKFCEEKDVCHNGKPLAINCRSCVNCVPTDNGKFYCKQWNAVIPNKQAILAACPKYKSIQ